MERLSEFDRPEHYHGLFRHFGTYYGHQLDLISAAVNLNPAVVLDLACGLGDFTGLLVDKFPRATVHGLDISPAYIAYAQAHNSRPNICYWISPAQSLPGLSWAGSVDTIFIKGSYHLFERLLPLDVFLTPAFRSLRTLIIIEKTHRSLASYPVPHSAALKRRAYVSDDLAMRRLTVSDQMKVTSLTFGEQIPVPRENYLDAVLSRQFSYLSIVSDDEMHEWSAGLKTADPIVIFEENVANIYQLK